MFVLPAMKNECAADVAENRCKDELDGECEGTLTKMLNCINIIFAECL